MRISKDNVENKDKTNQFVPVMRLTPCSPKALRRMMKAAKSGINLFSSIPKHWNKLSMSSGFFQYIFGKNLGRILKGVGDEPGLLFTKVANYSAGGEGYEAHCNWYQITDHKSILKAFEQISDHYTRKIAKWTGQDLPEETRILISDLTLKTAFRGSLKAHPESDLLYHVSKALELFFRVIYKICRSYLEGSKKPLADHCIDLRDHSRSDLRDHSRSDLKDQRNNERASSLSTKTPGTPSYARRNISELHSKLLVDLHKNVEKKADTFGRHHPADPHEPNLINMPSHIRSVVLKGTGYADVDMVAAHPSIMAHIFDERGYHDAAHAIRTLIPLRKTPQGLAVELKIRLNASLYFSQDNTQDEFTSELQIIRAATKKLAHHLLPGFKSHPGYDPDGTNLKNARRAVYSEMVKYEQAFMAHFIWIITQNKDIDMFEIIHDGCILTRVPTDQELTQATMYANSQLGTSLKVAVKEVF